MFKPGISFNPDSSPLTQPQFLPFPQAFPSTHQQPPQSLLLNELDKPSSSFPQAYNVHPDPAQFLHTQNAQFPFPIPLGLSAPTMPTNIDQQQWFQQQLQLQEELERQLKSQANKPDENQGSF